MSSLVPFPGIHETTAGNIREFIDRAERDVRTGRGAGRPVSDLLDEIKAAASLEALRHQVTPLIRQCFQADHAVYHWVGGTGQQFGWGSYPADWVSRYLDRGYSQVDPVIKGCSNCFHPIDWRRLDWSHLPARKFLEDAQAHGIGSQGLSIPIRGPHGQFAVFSVNRSCSDEVWQEFTAQRTRDLILTAHAYNEKVLELRPDRLPQAIPHLRKRELDALAYLAAGCSRAEAAARLNISESTLRTYIETARSKLSAANTTQAVAVAVSRGLIIV